MSNENKNRSALIIGLILIGIGMIFLLNSLGIATFRIWYFLSRFWPVLLILWGLNLILKKSSLWWIIPVLIFFLFIGVVIMPDSTLRKFDTGIVFNFNNQEISGVYQEDREFDADLEFFNIDLLYGANRLNIDSTDDLDKLFNVRLNYRDKQPSVYYNKSNATANLKVEQTRNINIGTGPETWDIDLTKNIPLNINIKAGAGDLLLDLKELKVENLKVEAGVGQLNIIYPDHTNETEIKAAAGNIKLTIPQNTALRIETKTVINNNNFEEIGLIRLYEDVYQSKNYGEVENRIKINISTSASNINVVYN